MGPIAVAVLGVSLAAGLLLRHSPPPAPVRIEARVEDGGLRSDGSVAPGRTWTLQFEGAALRLYRNGLPWGEHCPGGSGCTGGPAPGMRVPLERPGEYRAVVFAKAPDGAPVTLHDDVERARSLGVGTALSGPLTVY